MIRPLTVAVSQRIDEWKDRGERRDALDQRLTLWVAEAGMVPLPVPNGLGELLPRWLAATAPGGILLSGGNDVGNAPDRDSTEQRLLDYAAKRDLPVLGICRGMQFMAVCAGGQLVHVSGHVRTRHWLNSGPGWPNSVNSYHSLGLNGCPPGYNVTARSEDGGIEAIRHQVRNWEGWMWHPERDNEADDTSLARFRALFGTPHDGAGQGSRRGTL
ncbi:MAG TPA: gamma-glutamyl-gamma-aminobutyrate hydrolase family protein [Prosthecobacter sp.]|nr:gamma-glutamyl-gamma-aminobutyrate hydrolase family protein [Prosthecobacter sp.]